MPRDETPKSLKPLIAHGVDFTNPGKGDGNWQGDCPFCGKRDHFFADPKTGLWDCKVCGVTGNDITFLTKVSEIYAENFSRKRRQRLAKRRGIPPGILKQQGIGFDDNTDMYMIPVKSEKGTVRDIRRYSLKDGKLKSTLGCKAQLFGADALADYDGKGTVWLCEGEWDALAMRWLIRDSELRDIAVAVPGATTFKKEWPKLFLNKDVVVIYDNDDAGDRGSSKVYGKLKGVARSLRFMHWPDQRPSGYDLRDYAIESMKDHGDARQAVDDLHYAMHDEPRRGVDRRDADGKPDDGQYRPDLPDLVDMDVDEVLDVFRKAICMTPELELILKIMLAVALSNDVRSDPIWLYVVGPPGSGKTLLLTAFQGSERCVFRSTLTPASLVSGWKSEGGNDPSLIPQLNGKTLVAKDFTEILDMPSMAQDEIFSTLRGAFDGHVQKSFGNGVQREYHDCYFSILAGVTHAIHGHKKAHLGERFLRIEMENLKADQMDAVLDAAINSIGREHDTELKLQHAVASYLQRGGGSPPPIQPTVKKSITSLVKLIAKLRSQVERDPRTGEVSYRPKAELGTRLAKQLAKLGSMLAIIMDKDEVDYEIYSTLLRIAFDTVGGYSLDIIKAMMHFGGRATKSEVAEYIEASTATLHRRFEDLELIGVISRDGKTESSSVGGRPSVVYKMKKDVAKLWATAKGDDTWNKKRTSKRSRSSASTSAGRSAKTSPTSSRSRKEAKETSRRKRRRATR